MSRTLTKQFLPIIGCSGNNVQIFSVINIQQRGCPPGILSARGPTNSIGKEKNSANRLVERTGIADVATTKRPGLHRQNLPRSHPHCAKRTGSKPSRSARLSLISRASRDTFTATGRARPRDKIQSSELVIFSNYNIL